MSPLIELKAKHFAGANRVTGTARANLGVRWISNGHWAIARSRVKNSSVLASEELVAAAFGIQATVGDIDTLLDSIAAKPADKWIAQPWLYDAGRKMLARAFVSESTGQLVTFDDVYLAIAGLNEAGAILYGRDPKSAFRDGETGEETAFVIMPVSTVDAFPVVAPALKAAA